MAFIISSFIDIILHIDKYLIDLADLYGVWIYAILFLIIFLETGIVITPFLPGDSLIFAAGALSSLGIFNIFLLFFLLSIAAILGDTVNYWIGHLFGRKLLMAHTEKPRFIKKKYLDKTIGFYNNHGGKTIILARFIPIIRTFAPFVAGLVKMPYHRFLIYNISGGIIWVGLFSISGFLFGNIPFVQKNFSIVILAVIFISLIPFIIEYLKNIAKDIKN